MESIVVVAGSGVAAAAGLPTLYGPRSVVNDDKHSKILSCKEYGNFLPELWSFAKEQAVKAHSMEISEVHTRIAEAGWPIITQNIGGIHLRAGSENVVEVYGSLFRARCLRCGHESAMTIDCYNSLEEGDVPSCLKCGKERTRPDICLPDEGMRHRKNAERLLRSATSVVYVGVEELSGPVASWHTRVPYSVLVGNKKWGSFSRYIESDVTDWVTNGMSVH